MTPADITVDALHEADVRLDDGCDATVGRYVWDTVGYEYDERTRERNREMVGRYAQPPILPGWAITTHHSQGMTLLNLHLDPAGLFAPGQLYVGLSWAPSLAAPVTADHVLHERRVRHYQSQLFDKMEPLTDEVPVPT